MLLAVLLMTALLSACGQTSALPPGYAIVYGVSQYSSISDLRQPHSDAEAIAALLESQGYTVIGGPRINAEANRANLEADFAAVASIAEPDSRFFFYFAGHGYGPGMERYYGDPPFSQAWADYMDSLDEEPARGGAVSFLFLHGADPFNSVESTVAETVSTGQLAALLATVPSRFPVVVIDACHSGGFVGDDGSVDTVPSAYEGWEDGVSAADALGAVYLFITADDVRGHPVDAESTGPAGQQRVLVISAAGARDFSYEGDWLGLGNGVFTHFFLQTPTAADRDLDGYVTVTEAYSWTAAAIRSQINDYFFREDKFHPRVSGGAVDFVLFRSR